MLKVSFRKYQLAFKSPVLTSRGAMAVKNGYFVFISDGQKTGIGECSFIEGLSPDDLDHYEPELENCCRRATAGDENRWNGESFPSIRFGFETARMDFKNGGRKILFDNDFSTGKKMIPINGLVWMGDKEWMKQQIGEKLAAGFRCIKIKVGAIDFQQEVSLLKFIRSKFPPDIIEIRLDANGAFNESDVFQKLETLHEYHIHSIEQPVRQGQLDLMRRVCLLSPIPVALDEELIGVPSTQIADVLNEIRPQFIILKPALLGGFEISDRWIQAAEERNIGWWATSALESNIGLNAIAQWVFDKNNPLTQGLGTGSLYKQNINSPLFIEGGCLGYNPEMPWGEV